VQSDPIGLDGGLNTYGYAMQAPTINIDPLGLWSFSLEGFFNWGGGITIGENPDGTSFVNVKVGRGIGGGIGYDPNGTSPDYDPCNKGQSTSYGGAFGGVGVGYGFGELNFDLNGGYSTRNDSFYGNVDVPNPTFSDGRWELRWSASAGVEFGVTSR